MINDKRDIERFRQIAKLWVRYYYPKVLEVFEKRKVVCTIDKFNYKKEAIILNKRYINKIWKSINKKSYYHVDEMLENLQSLGIYKNYSIDRTTSICATPMERAVVRTTVAEEI